MGEWKKVRIGEFLTESKEEAINSDSSRRITVRLNCRGVEHRKLKAEKDGATKYYIRHAGQFIYGKQNIHKGAFGIIPKELEGFTSSADLPAFDFINDLCFPEFLNLWLQVDERYKALQKNVKGAGSQRLAVSAFLDEGISLPDLPTQKQIVKRISVNLKRVNELAKEIETQKGYAKQFRRNILQNAIEGKLTADWRKEHPMQEGNPDHDAEALFELIQKERKVDKKRKVFPPILDAEKPFELPTGWKWVRLGEITTLITDGKHGDSIDQADSGYFFLSAKDIQNEQLIYANARQIIKEDFLEIHRRTNLEPGDVCIVNTGATIGKFAIAPDNKRTYYTTFQKSVAVVKLVKPFVKNKYMKYFFMRNVPRLIKKSWGSAINNLLLSDMRKEMVPLPPLIEQDKIVLIVGNILKKVDQLEQQISQRKGYTNELMKNILRRAFEEK